MFSFPLADSHALPPTSAPMHNAPIHSAPMHRLTLSGCVAGGQSGHLYAWEVASGQLLAGFGAHYGAVLSIAITSDDQLVPNNTHAE